MESKEMAMKIAKLLDERKAIDVQVIDIALKSSFADYFVMASGGSERQMAALVDNIEDLLEPEGPLPVNEVQKGLLLNLSKNEGLAVGNIHRLRKIRQQFGLNIGKLQSSLKRKGNVRLVSLPDASGNVPQLHSASPLLLTLAPLCHSRFSGARCRFLPAHFKA